MNYKNIKKMSLLTLAIILLWTPYFVSKTNVKALASYQDLIANKNGIEVDFNQSAPDTFLDYQGNEITRDFDLDKKGILLSSNQNNSSVSLAPIFYGSFETTFRAYSAVSYHDETGKDWNSSTTNIPSNTDLKEVAFTFTAKDGQQFTVYITAGERWNTITPAARVETSGVSIGYHYSNDAIVPSETVLKNSGGYYTRIGGTTFTNVARTGSKLTSSDSKPVTFGFNQETMEVYVIHYGTVNSTNGTYRVVVDLDDETMGVRKINNFDEYSVSITMKSIASGRTANMIIYDINGQSLAGETLTNTTGPKISLDQPNFGVVGLKYYLEQPKSFDLIDGLQDFTGTVKMFDSNNNQVIVYSQTNEKITDDSYEEGCYFLPLETGKYRLEYQGKDLNGLLGEKREYQVIIVSDFIDSQYALKGNYRGINETKTLGINSSITVYAANVYSQMHNGKLMPAEVTILKDGNIYNDYQRILANKDFTLNLTISGEYQIIYSTPDYDGIGNTYEVKFTVSESSPNFKFGEPLLPFYSLNSSIALPQVTASLNNETKTVTAIVYDPDGARVNSSDMITLDKIGEYKVSYLVRYDMTYSYIQYFTVNYNNSDLFTTEDMGVVINSNSDSGNLYPNKATGITISASMEGGQASYNRIIDLSTSTKNDSLIELMVLPSQVGKLDLWQFTIRLTDVYDPKNYVDISVFKGSWGNEWSYVKAGSSEQVLSGWENGAVLTAYNTGTPIAFSFTGESQLGTESIKLYFDYQERAIYVDNIKRAGYSYGNQVIDLDSLDCFSENTLWKGFSTGEVNMSIHFEYLQTNQAKLLVKSIAGVDLSGDWVTDLEAPHINVDLQEYDSSTIPSGLVGLNYPILPAKAFDKIDGLINYQVKVYRDYQTAKQTEVAIVDNSFIPSEAGLYSIVYRSTDSSGNFSEKAVKIPVLTTLDDLDYLFAEPLINSSYVGKIYSLPKGEALGGAGNKEVKIKIIDPSGQIVDYQANKFKFKLNGQYQVIVEIRDFLNQSREIIHYIDVTISEAPIIYDFVVPKYFINGIEYILPDFEALDYTDLNNVKSASKQIEVIYNGITTFLKTDRKFIPSVLNDGDEITIRYLATSTATNKTSVVEYQANVVIVSDDGINYDLSRYFYKNNIDNVNLTESYIEFTTNKNNASISLVNPIIDSNISFEVVVPSEFNKLNSFNVTLTDYLHPEIAIDLTIFKNSTATDTTTLMSINGGPKQIVSGSFFERTTYGFAISFNRNSNSLIDLNRGTIIEKVKQTKYGNQFNGFPSNKVYLTFTYQEVTGNAALRVKSVANQPFSNVSEDRIRPMISPSRDFKLIGEINEQFIIPYAYASDVLNPIVKLSLTIKFGSQTLYEGNIDEDYVFTPNQYGIYRIIYTAIDGANRKQETTFIINIKDRIIPEIIVSDKVVETAKVNDKISLPKAEVKDNHTEDLRLYIFVIAPDGQLFTLKEGVYEFIPNLTGRYQIFYYVQDSYNNYKFLEYEIIVK